MSSQEENQTVYSSTQGKSLSQWPSYYPIKRDGSLRKRERTLAYLVPLHDEQEEFNGYRIIDERERWSNLNSLDELLSYIYSNNCDVYTSKLFGRSGGFKWLNESLSRENCNGYIASSSKTLVTLSFKHGNREYKIINASNWQSGVTPNDTFMVALRNIFTAYDMGTCASQASLGHAGLLSYMYKQQGIRRIYHPSNTLRSRIAKYTSGGRADDFTLARQYKKAYEIDRNNSYAVSASDGVPSGRVGKRFTIGLEGVYENKLSDVSEWQANGTSFCQAQISISSDIRHKFSPFYTRSLDGLLEWQTKPGTYSGYFWYPMLSRCEAIGYNVRLGKCFIWTELDRFMSEWVHDLVRLRYHFRSQGMRLEEELVKGIIVKSIGRFGMSNDVVTLVTKENRQENDVKWLNMQAVDGETMDTPYFMHTETNPDANHLTQIASQIICMNNLALYDEMVTQEARGNTVYASNFDAFFSEYPYIGELDGWKQKEHENWKPLGRRSYESIVNGNKVSKRPGVKHDGTK